MTRAVAALLRRKYRPEVEAKIAISQQRTVRITCQQPSERLRTKITESDAREKVPASIRPFVMCRSLVISSEGTWAQRNGAIQFAFAFRVRTLWGNFSSPRGNVFDVVSPLAAAVRALFVFMVSISTMNLSPDQFSFKADNHRRHFSTARPKLIYWRRCSVLWLFVYQFGSICDFGTVIRRRFRRRAQEVIGANG